MTAACKVCGNDSEYTDTWFWRSNQTLRHLMHRLESEPQQLGLIAVSLWEEGVWRSSGVRDYRGEWVRVCVSLQVLSAKLPPFHWFPLCQESGLESSTWPHDSVSAQTAPRTLRDSCKKLGLGFIDIEKTFVERITIKNSVLFGQNCMHVSIFIEVDSNL